MSDCTPLPSPAASFYRRALPEKLIAFSSDEGRQVFREALAAGTAEPHFRLVEQMLTQSEPAYCGLTSLAVALNSLEIDPGRLWKGPWRWFSEDQLDCCVPLEQVKRQGVTINDVACLARCNGAESVVTLAENSSIKEIRAIVEDHARVSSGRFLLASYSRRVLGQTGDGHFSPVGAFHAERDLVLIHDTARFKYGSYWIPFTDFFASLLPPDSISKRSRGLVSLTRSPAGIPILGVGRLECLDAVLAAARDATTLRDAFEGAATVLEHGEGFLSAIGGSDVLTKEMWALLDLARETSLFRAIATQQCAPPRCAHQAGFALLAVLFLALPAEHFSRTAWAELEEHRTAPLPDRLATEIASLRAFLSGFDQLRHQRSCCKDGDS